MWGRKSQSEPIEEWTDNEPDPEPKQAGWLPRVITSRRTAEAYATPLPTELQRLETWEDLERKVGHLRAELSSVRDAIRSLKGQRDDIEMELGNLQLLMNNRVRDLFDEHQAKVKT